MLFLFLRIDFIWHVLASIASIETIKFPQFRQRSEVESAKAFDQYQYSISVLNISISYQYQYMLSIFPTSIYKKCVLLLKFWMEMTDKLTSIELYCRITIELRTNQTILFKQETQATKTFWKHPFAFICIHSIHPALEYFALEDFASARTNFKDWGRHSNFNELKLENWKTNSIIIHQAKESKNAFRFQKRLVN